MSAQPGSLVTVRGRQWHVARIDAFQHCAVVTLEGREGGHARTRMRVIEPFDHVTTARPPRLVRRRRRAVIQRALDAIVHARPALGLWNAAHASIDLHAYQLEPALAVLRGATRVLLADAVGLGKTIQAGLILAELRERGWVDRALILCPAGVRATWASELEQRFRIPCAVVDQASLAERAASLPPGVNPWTSHATLVTSIDLVKRPEVMAALDEVPIDLVIADEAHHLTPGTDRGAAADRLASRAPWCVLVSATPHSGDVAAFDYLTALGRQRERIAIFRRTREDAGLATARRETTIRVQPGEAEARLLSAVEQYARAIWRARGAQDHAAQLVAITIARRAASSTLALERTLTRRLSLLRGVTAETQVPLPWDEEDEDTGDGTGSVAVLGARGLENDAAEHGVIERLLALTAACDAGAKLKWLRRALTRVREPAIVFTEYRDTVDAVVGALPASMRTAAMSGACAVEQRRDIVDAFNRGDLDVLVATDTAGEGLNLHHRCRLVIDVELPWNPLRLEQRLGRVDRLGQQRRVHAIRLFHAGSIEQRVLDRLRLRQRRASRLDDMPTATEIEMAAAAFDDAELPVAGGSRIERSRVPGNGLEKERLALQRTHPARVGIAQDAEWAAPKHARASRLVVLHALSCIDADGANVAGQPRAHLVEVAAPCARRRWPIAAQRAIAAAREDIALECPAVSQRGREDLAPVRNAVIDRIGGIRAQLAARTAAGIEQPSLFDRRTETAAARRAHIALRLDMALNRCRERLVASDTQGITVRLVAVWPVRVR